MIHPISVKRTQTHLNADVNGVRETLGGALPDDGEDLLEVGLVQLLLEEQHVLVEVLDQAVHVAAAVRDEGAALEQELLYHWRHLKSFENRERELGFRI